MATQKLVARLPLNYADFGEYALTEKGMEMYNSIIIDMLPDSCTWCGNEIIGDIDADYTDFDIAEIISAAAEKITEMDADGIWAE